MKSDENSNTGTTLNRNYYCSSPVGPKLLVLSKNSAFDIHRKRTRDELSYEETSSFKRPKFTEDENSSMASLPPIVKKDTLNEEFECKTSDWSQNKKDAKLQTKTQAFQAYSELNMKTRSEFFSQKLRDLGNQCIRGRKRSSILSKADSIKYLITEIVIPEWEQYLMEKRDKENNNRHIPVRSDAVWKKIMRD